MGQGGSKGGEKTKGKIKVVEEVTAAGAGPREKGC